MTEHDNVHSLSEYRAQQEAARSPSEIWQERFSEPKPGTVGELAVRYAHGEISREEASAAMKGLDVIDWDAEVEL